MASTIKLKRSAVPGKVPVAGDLEVGEIAVNTADAILYIKHTDGNIKAISGSGGTSGNISAVSVTAGNIVSNTSVTAGNIYSGNVINTFSITTSNITTGNINAGKVYSGNIINTFGITTSNITTGNVYSGNIINTFGITTGNITTDNITAGKVYSDSISNADGSPYVVDSNIYNGHVTIADELVVADHTPLSGTTTVRWLLSAVDNINNRYKFSTIDCINNGIMTFFTEYAVLLSDNDYEVANYASDVTDGNIDLYAIGDSSSVTITYQRTTLGSSTATGYVIRKG